MGRQKTENAPALNEDTGNFSHQYSANSGLARDDRRQYLDRIKYLRYEAEQDGFSLNPASERNFWRFVESVGQTRKAYLFLLDNGNLRAVWKDENDDQVGLQFRDDGMVHYVIFARSKPEEEITHAYGRVSIDTAITRQIEGFDLRPLVCA